MIIDASATTQVVEKLNNITVVRSIPADLPILNPCAMREGKAELMKRLKQMYPTRNAKNMVKFIVEAHEVGTTL